MCGRKGDTGEISFSRTLRSPSVVTQKTNLLVCLLQPGSQTERDCFEAIRQRLTERNVSRGREESARQGVHDDDKEDVSVASLHFRVFDEHVMNAAPHADTKMRLSPFGGH